MEGKVEVTMSISNIVTRHLQSLRKRDPMTFDMAMHHYFEMQSATLDASLEFIREMQAFSIEERAYFKRLLQDEGYRIIPDIGEAE